MRASVVQPRLFESNNPVSKDDIVHKTEDNTKILAQMGLVGLRLYALKTSTAEPAKLPL